MRRFQFPRDRAGTRLEPPRAEQGPQGPVLLARGVHSCPFRDAAGDEILVAVTAAGRAIGLRAVAAGSDATQRSVIVAQMRAELERRDPDEPTPEPRRVTASGEPLRLKR